MSKEALETFRVQVALAAKNININSTNTIYFPMTNYDRIVFVVHAHSQNVADTGRITLEARQATALAGTSVISMAANITNTTIVTANAVNTIEIRADQMNTNAGYIYAGCQVYETNTNICTVSATAIRISARYPQVANAMLG